MINIISVNNMRKSDELQISNGTPSKELMKNAGHEIFKAFNWYGKILIVSGSGNNAGDGYVLAKYLCDSNIIPTVFIIKNKFSNDGKYYYDEIKDKANIVIEDISKIDFNSYDIIVDCIFGTGFNGEVISPYKEIIEDINKSNAYKISVDINSGLNGDTGLAHIAVKSDLTLAIEAPKTGFYLNDGKDYIKNIKALKIGINHLIEPYNLIEATDLKELFWERKNNSNKGDYGYIGLIGGSIPYSGAIRLAEMANSAMRSGAGVCMVATLKELANIIIPNILESTIYPLSSDGLYIKFNEDEIKNFIKKLKSIAFGMGIGNNIDTKLMLEYILKNYDKTLIIDADGLNALSKIDKNIIKNSKAKIILTPHLKEFERLSGYSIDEIKNDPINLSMKYANELNLILLLKGPSTIITDGKIVNIVSKGAPGMATAGSGDVLSGIIAAITAYNPNNLLLATSAAAYINGRAGELAKAESSDITMISSDTANNIKKVIEEIIKN